MRSNRMAARARARRWSAGAQAIGVAPPGGHPLPASRVGHSSIWHVFGRHKRLGLAVADDAPVSAVDQHLGRQRAARCRSNSSPHHRRRRRELPRAHRPASGGSRRLRANVSPTFADRPHDVRGRHGRDRVDGGDRDDAVPGVVHRRANQVVHGGVQDRRSGYRASASPARRRPAAHPPDPTSQRPGSITTRTSRLCSAPRIAPARPTGLGEGSLQYGMPSPPPQSTTVTWWPGRAQRAHQFRHTRECGAVRREREDLAADMDRQSDRLDARQRRGAPVEPDGIGVGNAELVLCPAGGDLVVRAGIDVRVDPQCDARRALHGGGQAGEHRRVPRRFRR